MDINATNEEWQKTTIIRALKKMKIAGLRHAFKSGIGWTERLWWVGAFFLCLGFTAYLTVDTINEYEENPVLYTFDDDEPTYKVPFPGTTITGTMIFKNNTLYEAWWLHKKVEAKKKSETKGETWTSHLVDVLIFTIDHLCELVKSFATRNGLIDESNSKRLDLRNEPDWVQFKNVTLRDNMKDPKIRDTVVPVLKTRTLDCKNILIACSWEGSKENCTDLFVPIQTDVGSGCSFNRIPEELLTKQRGLMSLFNEHSYSNVEMQAWKKLSKERLDSVISVEGTEDFMNKMMRPRNQRHAGKLRGLSFMVKFDEDVDGMSCPIVDSNGYLLGIHSPFEEPQMMKIGVTIPPSHEVFVTVKADVTIADKGIKSLQISKRKCYFLEENPLENFKVYTVGNCHQECLGRTIQEKCNCTLLTRSAGQNETLCGPLDFDCVEKETDNLEKGRYDSLCVHPVCYPPCNEVKYGADAAYLPYHKNQFFQNERLKENSVTSITHVAFPSDSVSTRRRKLQYGFSIIVGVLGGLWGMTLEFSIFTFFNVLAGIGVLIFSNRSWMKVQNEEESGNIPCDEETPHERSSGGDETASDANRVPCILTIENETDYQKPSEEEHSRASSIGNQEIDVVDQDHLPDAIINENQNNLVRGFSSLSPGVNEVLSAESSSADDDSVSTTKVNDNVDNERVSQPPQKENPSINDPADSTDEIIEPENESRSSEESGNIPCDEETPHERSSGGDETESDENRVPCILTIENETDYQKPSEKEHSRASSIGNQETDVVDQDHLPDPIISENQNNLVRGFSSLSPSVDEVLSAESSSADDDSVSTTKVNDNVDNERVSQPLEKENPSKNDPVESTGEIIEPENESRSSIRDPIGWDELLDEIFELVEL